MLIIIHAQIMSAQLKSAHSKVHQKIFDCHYFCRVLNSPACFILNWAFLHRVLIVYVRTRRIVKQLVAIKHWHLLIIDKWNDLDDKKKLQSSNFISSPPLGIRTLRAVRSTTQSIRPFLSIVSSNKINGYQNHIVLEFIPKIIKKILKTNKIFGLNYS